MKEKLSKLLDVKSIVTIMLTTVFCGLSIKGAINADSFMVIMTMVMTYFFTKKKDDTTK